MNNKTQWVICGLEHSKPGQPKYFAAIHGYSPQFFNKDRARKFDSRFEAETYALYELFTTKSAFTVEAV